MKRDSFTRRQIILLLRELLEKMVRPTAKREAVADRMVWTAPTFGI